MIAILKLCSNALMQRASNGMVINVNTTNQINLVYGCILSKVGPSADPKKVEAIVKTTTPENVGQLRNFIGLANYCARFV
jgi:hypothetical protein